LQAGGGTGDQPRTGYDERDADIKITYDIAANRRLIAVVQHVTQDDAWRVHKTIFAKSWRGTTTGDELRRSLDQRRTLAYLQYEARDMTALASNMTLSLSWHQQDEEQLRVRNDGRYDRQGTDVGTLGLWGQWNIPARRGPWTAGAEVYRDSVDSFRKEFNADGTPREVGIQGPVADDASYVIADAFVQKQTAIGDNIRGRRQMQIRCETRRRASVWLSKIAGVMWWAACATAMISGRDAPPTWEGRLWERLVGAASRRDMWEGRPWEGRPWERRLAPIPP